MGKFENDSKELLKYVGGSENISAVTHCVTRMRFVLNDPSKANKDEIEKLKSVKGTFTQAGQFQVIIGNEVSDFYNDFIKISGVDGVSKDEVKDVAKNNMTFMQKLMANIAEIFSPLIPAIIVGGLILGFRNIIGDMKLLEDGTKSLVEVSQFWAGTNSFLWLIGEAIFHFLPVGITWSITKKMGTTQILGIVLGITLVSPQLLNAYAVAGADKIPFWDFGFAHVNMIGYQAQVIPAIMAGFVLVFLERGSKKNKSSININDNSTIFCISTSCFNSTYCSRTYRLGNWFSNFKSSIWRINIIIWNDFCSNFWILICTTSYYRTSSYDKCNRSSINGTIWWNITLANDSFI